MLSTLRSSTKHPYEFKYPMNCNDEKEFFDKWCVLSPVFNQIKHNGKVFMKAYERLQDFLQFSDKYSEVNQQFKQIRNHWISIYAHYDLKPTFPSYFSMHHRYRLAHGLEHHQSQYYLQQLRDVTMDALRSETGIERSKDIVDNWNALQLPEAIVYLWEW